MTDELRSVVGRQKNGLHLRQSSTTVEGPMKGSRMSDEPRPSRPRFCWSQLLLQNFDRTDTDVVVSKSDGGKAFTLAEKTHATPWTPFAERNVHVEAPGVTLVFAALHSVRSQQHDDDRGRKQCLTSREEETTTKEKEEKKHLNRDGTDVLSSDSE